MKALRFEAWGEPPRFRDVPVRDPEPGEVLLEVSAAGICHSDLHIVDGKVSGVSGLRPPFTLGHETAGRISALGNEVDGLDVGESVVVYGPSGCGRCTRCREGRLNYCDRRRELPTVGVGLGSDGGMAEYLTVGANRVVPIGDLAPAAGAALADAGLTAYHAVMRFRDRLGPGSAAVVIGVGGLGHLAVQILRAMTPSWIIALDIRDEALELATVSGADAVTHATPDAGDAIRSETSGRGADVVLDFVVGPDTLELAASVLRPDGELAMVGGGGGTFTLGRLGGLQLGCRVSIPFWGTLPELADVVALARNGRLTVHTTPFPLADAPLALDRLRQGAVTGRAVLVP